MAVPTPRAIPVEPTEAPSNGAIPPLENGDRLTRAEFERRYEAMPELNGHSGPPTISSGYWTNDTVLGTFDHHDAGLVDVRPGQGIASRCGAFEHGTAESRGGRGRG